MTDKRQFFISSTDTGDGIVGVPQLDGQTGKLVTWPDGMEKGKPQTLDWQAAMGWLVAKVACDGLPEGHGRQAEVIRWLRRWFEMRGKDGQYPSDSRMKEMVNPIFELYDKMKAEKEEGR